MAPSVDPPMNGRGAALVCLREGSTPNGPRRRPGLASPSWTTGSPPPRLPPDCNRSVTRWGRCDPDVLSTLVDGLAAAVDRNRSGRGLLVGHLNAPGEGIPTIVFDAPCHARGFFDALCTDNLDIGRPQEMQVIFGRRVATASVGGYRTRLLRCGDEVALNAYFRRCRVKSYLKCGWALRIETVINDTGDLGVRRRLEQLDESRARPVTSTVA